MKRRRFTRILSILTVLLITLALLPGLAMAEEETTEHSAEWWNSRNSEANNAVTDRPTPVSAEEAWGKWAVSFGTGFNASPTPPIIVDGKLYIASANKVLELDKETGQVLRTSAAMPGTVGYAMYSPLYVDGKIFVTITDSRICAINIEDLSIAWVTDNSQLVKGQMVSPLSYKKIDGTGYIYSGTLRDRAGELLCATTDDSGLISPEGWPIPVKALTWTFNPEEADAENLAANASVAKGYYWTGAYVSENYLAIGSDNGEKVKDEAVDTAFYTLNPKTGAIIDAVYGIHGQVRSTTVYNEGFLYFSTKSAKLYKIPVNEEGILGEPSFIDLSEYGATTSSCTPVVYGGRIYLGLSGKGGKLSTDGGHGFMVVRDDEVLSSASYIYTIQVPGYPQGGAILSNFHESEDFDGDGNPDGRVYLYFTYNALPGGIFYTYDTPVQTAPAPITTEESRIFVPAPAEQQYCLSSIVVDTEGTMYYKNDSGYLFAVESNAASLSNLEVFGEDGTQIPLNQPFQAKIQDYSFAIPSAYEAIRVKLTLEDGVYAEVAGIPYEEGGILVPTTEASSEIKIVIEKNGKTRNYTLHVQKASSVADLASLASSIVNAPPKAGSSADRVLTPEFDKDITEYSSNWFSTGTGGTTDPASTARMNLFLKAESAEAQVKVWPLENVDTSGTKVQADGSIPSFAVSNASYNQRFPVYSADIKKDSVVRIDVTAQDGVTVKSYKVTFNRRIYAKEVTVDPVSAELSPEESIELRAVVTPDNATDKSVIWTSSDEKIAVVDENGTVTATGEGEAVIKASSPDGPFAECMIAVSGHITEPVEKKDPTCDEEGFARDCFRCKYCGRFYEDVQAEKELSPDEVLIAPLGHTLKEHPEVPATYETKGSKAYWECTVCGKLFGDAEGTKEITLKDTVIPKRVRTDISKAVITVENQTYTGKALKPVPVVRLGKKVLKKGTDYSVSYSNNINAGDAKVTVKGKGDYRGSAAATFKIKKAKTVITIKDKSAVYTGKTISIARPSVNGSTGKITVTYFSDKSCMKPVKKHSDAGTYYVKAKVEEDANHLAAVSNRAVLVIRKAANTLTAQGKTITASRTKNMTFAASKAITVRNAKGTVTYEKVSGNSKIIVAKNGSITVKKGLTKGKTYIVRVKTKAAGTKNYQQGSKTVQVKVKIK